MSNRSLNKAQLIGNLTKDPELRYTPQGTAVCNFSVATNRSWKDKSGEVKEAATFHRIVAWDKLAEIVSQLLQKGSKVYIEGRIDTRQWQDQEGNNHSITEIVSNEVILLGGGIPRQVAPEQATPAEDIVGAPEPEAPPEP